MSMSLVDRFGRKGLLITSTLGAGLCVFALGTFFYIDENKCLENGTNSQCNKGFTLDLVNNLNWMPVVSNNSYHLDKFDTYCSLTLAGVNCAVHLHLQYRHRPSAMGYHWRDFP